jgi:hypothetical protein
MALFSWFLIPVGGKRSQCPRPSPILGSLGLFTISATSPGCHFGVSLVSRVFWASLMEGCAIQSFTVVKGDSHVMEIIHRHSALLGYAEHYLGLYKTNVYLKYLMEKLQVNAKPLRCLWRWIWSTYEIHNGVPNALYRREEFQSIETIQNLWLMFAGKIDLWWRIWEGYINYLEAQRFIGDGCKGKALKEVKLVNDLCNYMQSWVYML